MDPIGFARVSDRCALCDADGAPRTPLDFGFERRPEACVDCAREFASGQLELEPLHPSFDRQGTYRWVGVQLEDITALATEIISWMPASLPEDCRDARPSLQLLQRLRPELERAAAAPADQAPSGEARRVLTARLVTALLAGSALAVEVLPPEALDRLRMRVERSTDVGLLIGLHQHLRGSGGLGDGRSAPRPKAAQKALLERVRRAYLVATPPAAPPWPQRMAAIQAALFVELDRLDDAARTLDDALRDGGAAHEPRLPHLRGLLYVLEGHARAADEMLELAATSQAAETCSEVVAATAYNRYLRAAGGERWGRARARLAEYCRLRSDDSTARFELAQAYIQSSLDPVAREILGSVLDGEAVATFEACYRSDERRAEGVLLYGTCLLRLGASTEGAAREEHVRRARQVAEEHLENASDDDPWRSALYSLLAHCHAAAGDTERALRAACEAFYGEPSRVRARDVGVIAQRLLHDALDEPEVSPVGLATAIRSALPALLSFLGKSHAHVLLLYLLHTGDTPFELKAGDGVTGPGGDLRSSHFDGSTVLAYLSLTRNNSVEAWERNQRAVNQGAAPVPFSLLGRLRRVYGTWDPRARSEFDALVGMAASAI